MINRRFFVAGATLLLAVGMVALAPCAAANDAYASASGDAVLTVTLHPSAGTIRSLKALRAQGLIPTQGIRVVGVYHTSQRTGAGPS